MFVLSGVIIISKGKYGRRQCQTISIVKYVFQTKLSHIWPGRLLNIRLWSVIMKKVGKEGMLVAMFRGYISFPLPLSFCLCLTLCLYPLSLALIFYTIYLCINRVHVNGLTTGLIYKFIRKGAIQRRVDNKWVSKQSLFNAMCVNKFKFPYTHDFV